MKNSFITEPKEMMSESLQDVMPNEEMVKTFQETFISVLLVHEDRDKCLVGNLVGIEFETSNPLGHQGSKIDIRASINDVFQFVSSLLVDESGRRLEMILLSLGDNHTKVVGPYLISNTKIIDIDPSTRLCILAVDLEKIGEKNEE
jgi:hypothetical protein